MKTLFVVTVSAHNISAAKVGSVVSVGHVAVFVSCKLWLWCFICSWSRDV